MKNPYLRRVVLIDKHNSEIWHKQDFLTLDGRWYEVNALIEDKVFATVNTLNRARFCNSEQIANTSKGPAKFGTSAWLNIKTPTFSFFFITFILGDRLEYYLP